MAKNKFVQRAHQYMCTAKWRMHAYECGLKTRDSTMINVTGGNAWMIDDASVSLSLLSFSLSLSLNHQTRHGPHQSQKGPDLKSYT